MGTDHLNTAIQQELRQTIAQKTQKHTLSLTDELMGYTFYAADKQRQYDILSRKSESPRRRIAVPEFLTGFLKNGKV